MKFTMFSDFHHHPQRFMRGTFEDLDVILKASEQADVDFIIHAGDLTFGPSNHLDFVKKYNEFHIPTYNCLGNHDTDATPEARDWLPPEQLEWLKETIATRPLHCNFTRKL